ncbi:hypothetical protein M427DRAFT_57932 [Gonapodya prolifera JEL478]|uniref:DNA2/NAM7 helicase-like C-terminal domain-containing protein n=1 Tax=Gonapodya prolifera (strain JEL478) TaxID=1344416 RepID=A0A139ACN2_GONPJ|nr:hypothetical protein M427DRAFT_57932 [Gonapodya prolifera JEL478]|eukprot:KXS14173.1 hypothetical protein M427DRAFT_57932 [Gonapodya prolifera JEL478]
MHLSNLSRFRHLPCHEKTLKESPQHCAVARLDRIFEKPVKSLVTVRVTWSQSVEPATLPCESHVTEEAVLVSSFVRGLRADFPKERIFVVTPHRIQRAAIKEMLSGDMDDMMRIDTVERMQGDEADIVVVCHGFTTYAGHSGYSSVSDGELEFIFQRNRLNVALFRDKSLCIFVVADELFRRGPPFSVIASSERSDAWMFMSAFVDRSRELEWTAGHSSTGDSDSDGGYNSQEYSNNSTLDWAFAELVLE